jgi:hypothetical protein
MTVNCDCETFIAQDAALFKNPNIGIVGKLPMDEVYITLYVTDMETRYQIYNTLISL